MLRNLALAVAMLCAAVPAAAQTRQDLWDRCKSKDNHDLAIGACTALIQSGTETDANLSSLFMNRGVSYAERNDIERAMRDYETALKLDPSNATVYYNRALIYLDRKDHDSAWRDADAALRVKPSYSDVYVIRGEVLRRRGRYAEAATEYDKAVSATIDDPDVDRYIRGRREKNEQQARCGDPQPDLSIGACTAIINDKTMTEEALAGAYNRRGIAHDRNQNPTQSVADYTEAIRLKPNDAVILANRGVANIWAEHYEDAAKDFERSLAIDPKRPATINGFGLLARQQGDYAAALQKFTAAIDLSPKPLTDAATSYFSNRGITYLLMERYDEALPDLERALQLNPKSAFPLFARGVVKRRKGDIAGGDADIAAAKSLQSDIEAAMAKRKVKM